MVFNLPGPDVYILFHIDFLDLPALKVI